MSEDAEVTISYLILCHDSPDRIVRLVTRILSDDETGQVVIHFDKNSSRAKFNELKERLRDTPRCRILEKRVKCGWGQWSLVKASLFMLHFAYKKNRTTYYYLLSEYCYPVTKLSSLVDFLSESIGHSFIECFDKSWIKDGIREDRYLYRHFVSKRKYPGLHRFLYRAQKKISLRRKKPKDLSIKFGSQWWCLYYKHVDAFFTSERNIYNFFKLVWIPDECFFATLISRKKYSIVSASITYSEFDDSGKPMMYNSKELPSNLTNQNKFFIRKVQ